MSKKAVIQTGGKQYVVSEGDVIEVELLGESKTITFEPLLVIKEKIVKVGTPTVKGSKVTAQIIEPLVKGEKVTVIRYKAKKRVKKIQGHRQKYTKIKIVSIE
ncbi:MAG TPA: 50S ribosomal protein L21 [Candidatus Saccharimonadales bacterium]|nr:50S ribosomal protein L21 [Candidatus Saccharimonadales bacterium]